MWARPAMGYLSSRAVKKTLREKIYGKLLRLGSAYKEQAQTSEVVQVAVEGVDQLETYFGAYLPQFFYAMLAPLTLFVVLCFVNVPAALVLLVCVPMIPVAIAAVQTWAKKLLSKYWDQYTALGDTFLENLQGLTTLKIYRADAFKNEEMNEQSEKFRRITMKVLPLLPAFPFLLLAAFCFGKSSEKLHTWFTGTRLYKNNLESYVQGKGMTKKTKVRIMVTVTILMSIGFIMMHQVPVGRIVLGGVWVFHIFYFLFGVKTLRPETTAELPE